MLDRYFFMDNVECDEVMVGAAFMVPQINYYNEHIYCEKIFTFRS